MLSHSRAQGVAHARSPPPTTHNGLLHIIAKIDGVAVQVYPRHIIGRPDRVAHDRRLSSW
jgi:hypothetical protein